MNGLLNKIGNTRLGRYLGKKYYKKGTILCYHRVMPHLDVLNDKSPGRGLAISDKCFEGHLEHLAKNYNVISMDKMYDHILSDSDEYFVSITFDDGYKDNLNYALPILEKYNLPAIIYIVTKHPQGDGWIWWYELEDHIMNNDHINFSFREYSIESSLKTLKQKYSCFDDLRNFVIKLNQDDQKKFLSKLSKSEKRKDYSSLMLTWDEIKLLDKHQLITIGAHTHTHANLKSLDKNSAIAEMKKSKVFLEEELKHSINHFAYPFGSEEQVGEKVANYPEKLNFNTAVSTNYGFVETNNLLLINRISLGWTSTVDELESNLNGFAQVL